MIKDVHPATYRLIAHCHTLPTSQFDEKRFPLTASPVPADYSERIPDDREIFEFMDKLFEAATLSAECGIITLVYINRCIQYTELAMHATNWKRILLGGILMASKVWDDQVCPVHPHLSCHSLSHHCCSHDHHRYHQYHDQ